MEQLNRYYKVYLGGWGEAQRLMVAHQYASRKSAARATLEYMRREVKRNGVVGKPSIAPLLECELDELRGDLVTRVWLYSLYCDGQIEIHCLGSVKVQYVKA